MKFHLSNILIIIYNLMVFFLFKCVSKHRFIDVAQGQRLHLWRGESFDSGFHSLVSAICSCGSDKIQTDKTSTPASWIAAGLSSGHCRLFDARSGSVLAHWRAHEGYVTKVCTNFFLTLFSVK